MKIRWREAVVLLLIATALCGTQAARWLVVSRPGSAGAILVLAGETDLRPSLGVQLLNQGYAPIMILDVPAGQRVYQWTAPELAQRWVSGLPQASQIKVCPIYGLSTKAEAHDAAQCLEKTSVRTVLLVTSDYHSRRALSTFAHELPKFAFSIASAADSQQFGVKWWQHREWAKTTLYEWMRLVWWEAVDRWR